MAAPLPESGDRFANSRIAPGRSFTKVFRGGDSRRASSREARTIAVPNHIRRHGENSRGLGSGTRGPGSGERDSAPGEGGVSARGAGDRSRAPQSRHSSVAGGFS
ncbi:MAG: hypothetical protein COY42_30595 [Armatimonadetes bacterium CG_4_10_14_0_8_um_filter_66_14]|nr:MAG: hypothetical protein COY42_30595 [Armatimonadetes bacterium CG_4_10_14_0_8_um_filter_66_14]PJB68169.1 MAG: hypothetical protein CO096_15030 [Armatimonadetes bacterium CG_4_9_14_3_um_filter_66_14]